MPGAASLLTKLHRPHAISGADALRAFTACLPQVVL